MKVKDCRFRMGEVYLFHARDPLCGPCGSLWATYDKTCGGRIHLEASTSDHRRFALRQELPDSYRYCRLATRDELRDYMTNAAFALVSIHRHYEIP